MIRQKIANQIKSFANLKDNWDTYGAAAINKQTIEKALWLVNKMTDEELVGYNAIPTVDGINIEDENVTISISVYVNNPNKE